MKKFLRNVIVVPFFALMLLFVGCVGGSPKTFTKEGMSIELTDKFVEKEHITMTCYYETSDMFVAVLKEEFSSYISSSLSLTKYAEKVISANKMDGIEVFLSEKGYAYFVYSKEASGNEYTYYATCHKAEDAFWLIQFGIFSKNYEDKLETIQKYANSIAFETETNDSGVL